VKQFIYETASRFSTSVLADHLTCNYRTTGVLVKEHIQRHLYTQLLQEVSQKKKEPEDLASEEGEPVYSENDTNRPMPSYKTRANVAVKSQDSRPPTQSGRLLELMQKRMEEEQELRKMYPKGGHNNLLVYVEDLHMTRFDDFNDNTAAETLRELITNKEWYNNKKQSLRHVDNVNVIACLNTDNIMPHKVPDRLLRHFTAIGIEELTAESSDAILNKLFEVNPR
jgi:hypothetical protein